MAEKTLVLTADADAYYFGRIAIPNVEICSVFRDSPDKHGTILRFFRKINSLFTRFYYLEWYKHIGEYQKIIITDNVLALDRKLLENIRKKAPNSGCYIYSWNIVKNVERHHALMKLAQKTGFKFYCYDKGTCSRYGLWFNTIMYDKSLRLPKSECEYDMFFLGFLKDRKRKMLTLHDAMTKGGLNPRFVITGKKNENLPFEFRESYVNYYDYLDMLNKSRAILDIAQNEQDGFSMRVMESIFFNKKLITTNTYVRDSIFFDPNNIFIIDLDNIDTDKIRQFFERDFHPYSEEIKQYYSFEEWLKRFN